MKFDTRRLAACLGKLTEATDYVEACADYAGIEAEVKFGVLLALEEAFVNVCTYAYPDALGDVELTCEVDGHEFVLEVADRGKPFDVLSFPAPTTSDSITDLPVGGLGIHLIRSLSHRVTYRRDDDCNILRMLFRAGQA